MSEELFEGMSGVEPRLVLVGGFLGAGKTTLIGWVVDRLMKRGVECGVVTNDQAAGLVDTKLMQAVGAESVAEVAGGCFCCRLEELVGVLRERWGSGSMERGGGSREFEEGESLDEVGFTRRAPLVFAEPVGSCTDLMSTVVLPLRRVYQVPLQVGPLSVVVDGRRALASLGGRRTPGCFSKDVGYIYRKQLEEAEIVVVNKVDVMEDADVAELLRRLAAEYPGKEVFEVCARSGDGVEAWLERVLGGGADPERLMDVDYERYGVGEALLGWVNAEVEVGGAEDGDGFLLELAEGISGRLGEEGCEVAHFKMALTDGNGRLGTVNQTMGGVGPESSRSFGGGFREGVLTVNLRAEGDPERLRAMVENELASWARRAGSDCRVRELAAFRPGQPVPTAKVMAV